MSESGWETNAMEDGPEADNTNADLGVIEEKSYYEVTTIDRGALIGRIRALREEQLKLEDEETRKMAGKSETIASYKHGAMLLNRVMAIVENEMGEDIYVLEIPLDDVPFSVEIGDEESEEEQTEETEETADTQTDTAVDTEENKND